MYPLLLILVCLHAVMSEQRWSILLTQLFLKLWRNLSYFHINLIPLCTGVGNLFLRSEERVVFWRNSLWDVKVAANI